jgi:hypothetical protein
LLLLLFRYVTVFSMYILLLVEAARAWSKERNDDDVGSNWVQLFPTVLAALTLGFTGIAGLLVFCGSLSILFSVCFIPVALIQFAIVALINLVLWFLHMVAEKHANKGKGFLCGCGNWLISWIRDATSFSTGYMRMCTAIWEGGLFENLEKTKEDSFFKTPVGSCLARFFWILCGWWVDLWPALKNLGKLIGDGDRTDLMAVPLLACSVSLVLSPLVLYGTMLAFHVYGGQTITDLYYDPEPGSNGLIRDVYSEVFFDYHDPKWGWPGMELSWDKMIAAVSDGAWPDMSWTPERLMEDAEGMFTFGAFLGAVKCVISLGMELLAQLEWLGVTKGNIPTAAMCRQHGNQVHPSADQED